MSFYFFLNESLLGTCYYRKIYKPRFEVDISDINLKCQMSNKLQFICMYPRINILKIISFTEFFFHEVPTENYNGKVSTRCNIYFSKDYYETYPCDIYVKGFLITRIDIDMPKNNELFLRELKFQNRKKHRAKCCICFDERNDIINVHEDQYNHFVCALCILNIDKCPICRQNLF